VAEQLETALFEGLCPRIARRLHRSPVGSSQPQTTQVAEVAVSLVGARTIKVWEVYSDVREAYLARIADNRTEAAREMQVLRQMLDNPFMQPITDAAALRARLDHLQHRDDFLSRLERGYRNQHPDR
jgi:hypothetical protein